MQLYVADYLADTAHLTTEEHGAYLLLLFNYWQTGKPLRAERLAAVTRLPNERWQDVEKTLSDFFYLQDGLWINERVERDLEAVKSKSIKASDAGKASARAKASRKQGLADGCSTDVETNVQRNVNHTEADTEADTSKSSCHQQADDDTVGRERIDYGLVAKSFAEHLPGLPQPRDITEKRRKMIRSIVKRGGRYSEDDFFPRFFAYVQKSDFLMGRSEKQWHGCCFDWILKPENFQKIIEGNYHTEKDNA
jgi:uncharacterized protein YdaU (DUF1376 family)